MDFTHFVAKKYLVSKGEKHFFSWITRLSIAGVVIGVAALIVVLAVVVGFEKEFRDRFLAANAHVLIFNYPKGISDYKSTAQDLKKAAPEEIKGISPFVHFETLAVANDGTHAALVRGILPKSREQIQSLKRYITPFKPFLEMEETTINGASSAPAVVGKGLLRNLGLKVGDSFNIVGVAGESFGSESSFEVVGVYDSGFSYYDDKLLLVSLTSARNLFGYQKQVTGLEVGLHRPNSARQVAQTLSPLVGAKVTPWQNFNKKMFDNLVRERSVIMFIVFLVCIVASFNVLTALFIAVTLKQKDVSILKAIGATSRDILKIFLKQGMYIGVAGTTIGLLLGLFLCYLLQNFKIVDLPEEYLVETLPVVLVWDYFALICLSSIFICTLAGIYPARVASRMAPVDGFRAVKN